MSLLAEFTRTVSDDHVDYDGLFAVFVSEFLTYNFLEIINEFIRNQVDGAAAKATAHDS